MVTNDLSVKIMLLTLVLTLLPGSPFSNFQYLLSQVPYLNILNWFIPISEIITITEGWLLVVAVYYSILFILNYVGIVKS